MSSALVSAQRWQRSVARVGAAVLVSAGFAGMAFISCTESPTDAGLDLALTFSTAALDLGGARASSVEIRNSGNGAIGPIQLSASPVVDAGGNAITGSSVSINPSTVPTLNAGQSTSISVEVAVNNQVQSGQYSGSVTARAGSDAEAVLAFNFVVTSEPTVEISALTITTATASLRQGDALDFEAQALDTAGSPVSDLPIVWSVSPASSGFVDASGRFVGYTPGDITVTATYGSRSDTHTLSLTPRSLSGSATKVGSADVTNRHTSDLWVHGNYAYTGTWGQRIVAGVGNFGDQLYAWDISDPTSPVRTHTLTVEARTVNDVKVRADGTLAMLTHEGSNDGLNGVTILDLADPSTPVEVSRFTSGLESGIHNVWIEGNYAYLVLDGTGNGLRVMDISNPASPTIVANFYAGTSFLHDVYVRDGIAFLSHWNAGIILLDVGNGIVGGSPTNPVEISRIGDLGGQTHNAWYWPESGYIFVGEEDFSTPGHMRVIDASDLLNPVLVATHRVPGTTPHNFWLDEANEVLYLAWYENGLRAIDVSGTLTGEIDRQGREAFGVQYDIPGSGCASSGGTCAWAPQLHQGYIYVSDMNAGMVVLQPSP